jgi:methionine synthase II (cobalamin-independent)
MENPSTTVVGSWSLINSQENMERIFNDLIKMGIDYPCYPQLTSMISQFLSPLTKEISPLEEINQKFYLSDDFEIPKKPIALEYGKFIKNFFNNRPELLKQIKGTKACLTGPITLASEIILKDKITNGLKARIFAEPRAVMVDWIVEKIAEIMKQVAKEYNKMGIDIISMDEPLLGVIVGRKVLFHSEDFLIKVLNKSISEIKSISSIHVCGRISPKCRDILLQTDVKILDHEFRTNKENFDIFQKEHLINNDKILGLGTVKSKFVPVEGYEINDYVEGIYCLETYIRKAIQQYGKENLIIKPDCGFNAIKNMFKDENFAYEISLRKVKNMVLALKRIIK